MKKKDRNNPGNSLNKFVDFINPGDHVYPAGNNAKGAEHKTSLNCNCSPFLEAGDSNTPVKAFVLHRRGRSKDRKISLYWLDGGKSENKVK